MFIDNYPWLLVFIFTVGVISLIIWISKVNAKAESDKVARMTPDQINNYYGAQRAERHAHEENATTKQYGYINAQIVCPHCQQSGAVRTTQVSLKQGISGAKATGAILTGGASLLVTGLSQKVGATQAHCDTCHSNWTY
jgi:hypothetical protein